MNQELLTQFGLSGTLTPISGGDVNQTFRLRSEERQYFLKYHPGVSQQFFQAEAAGLAQLRPYVRVPAVYQYGDNEHGAYLLLEWIDVGEGDQESIATALAEIHRQTSPTFGFEQDNFIGLLPQVNPAAEDWVSFYTTCRLDVQVELAKLGNHWNPRREDKYLNLKETLYQEWSGRQVQPSLLHGDFWRGNVLFDQKGDPVFIDPAVSFGDRELDLAMAQLFGGFRPEFFQRYQQVFPLEKNWQERVPVYQLYYLLVHLNLFGESYGNNVDEILSRY